MDGFFLLLFSRITTTFFLDHDNTDGVDVLVLQVKVQE